MTGSAPNPFQEISSDFWNQYIKGRPPLAESLLQRIWSYHASHGGLFNLLHEPGAGAGVHSRRFATKFQKVIVSDISPSNITAAKSHLQDLSNITFRVGPLEDYSGIEKESVDMILAINCIHWTDIDKALESVQHQLKPGGTFVSILFCHSVLKDPRAQELWLKISWRTLASVWEKDGVPRGEQPLWLKKVVSGGNALPFPETVFEPGVKRVRINYEKDFFPAYVPEEDEKAFERLPDQFGKSDEIVSEKDEVDWGIKADVKRLKEMMDAVVPLEGDEDIDGLWKEFRDVVGDREMEGTVPVSCILATKRRNARDVNGVH
ncbi:hypothetical protein AC578_3291 [Pseudocercospora eumusae]|uniref:Methyltransferase type 11 domain-containing protein n=1 Tax=Pseudocercospora eumusae TaxID=321146 RepID=A0A139HCI0_9PEZI|nr:hypothetical protein AC578_3291 [Pseudocercospora eumusae]